MRQGFTHAATVQRRQHSDRSAALNIHMRLGDRLELADSDVEIYFVAEIAGYLRGSLTT